MTVFGKTTEKRRAFAVSVIMLLVIMLLPGCGLKEIAEDDEGTTGMAQLTVDFQDDTVFTVADSRVSRTEWYLYALPKISEAESMYGKDIWKYVVDNEGRTMAEALREEVKNHIIYIKIVCLQADRLGVSLNEDDQMDINIQTDEFLNKLTPDQMRKYCITPEIVKGIYADNILAMKVYENLTLNMDTNIPDSEVRHMVLEYCMVNKSYENEDGEFVDYTDEELARIRADLQSFADSAASDPSITRLSETGNEKYNVTELVADYSELVEKLPGQIPDIAFNLRQDEIIGVYETDDALFVLDCVERTNQVMTDAARVRKIEEKQTELFEREYATWESEIVIKLNYKVWDSISVE